MPKPKKRPPKRARPRPRHEPHSQADPDVQGDSVNDWNLPAWGAFILGPLSIALLIFSSGSGFYAALPIAVTAIALGTIGRNKVHRGETAKYGGIAMFGRTFGDHRDDPRRDHPGRRHRHQPVPRRLRRVDHGPHRRGPLRARQQLGSGSAEQVPMDLDFTDEQHDFAAAIRDFCRRECGTPEQRERLTNGYTEIHSRRDLLEARRPRLARRHDRRGAGRLGRRDGRRLHLHGGDLPRARPDQRLRHHPDRRRRRPALRHRRAEAQDPRRHRLRLGRGDRDDRARGRLRRRLAHHLGRALERRLRPQRPEGLLLERPHLRPRPRRLPHHQGRDQARGPLDDLRPGRQPRDGDQADRHARRPRDQLPLPHRLRGRPRTPLLGEVDHGWTQLMAGPQRRAPDPRRDDARPGRARLRRRPRLRQGAQAVRQARSAPSRRSSTASPTSPPSSRPPAS